MSFSLRNDNLGRSWMSEPNLPSVTNMTHVSADEPSRASLTALLRFTAASHPTDHLGSSKHIIGALSLVDYHRHDPISIN
jgi:hypothetical protein